VEVKLLDSIGTSVEYLCNRLDKATMTELADALDTIVCPHMEARGSSGMLLQGLGRWCVFICVGGGPCAVPHLPAPVMCGPHLCVASNSRSV
jgi:hypothetical protein